MWEESISKTLKSKIVLDHATLAEAFSTYFAGREFDEAQVEYGK